MRVLGACSLGGSGHWRPLLPLLQAAARRGDEVLVVAPEALRDMVEGDGFHFVAGGAPPESEVAAIRERLPSASAQEASVLANRELFGRLATDAMLPTMSATCRDWAPDLVLREPCEYASAIVANDRSIPWAQVACSLAEVEWGSIILASPSLERHRSGLTGRLRVPPYLTSFPKQLDPSPFAATIRFHVPSPQSSPMPDWWGGSDAPLVYLTLGTVLGHMTIAADQYRLVIAALKDLDVRVLLTVGGRFDPAELGDVPALVHVERWVDQARVLTEADLVVCHGGSGTVFGAVAAGVPLVVLPSFADQFANGRLVAGHGLGLVVLAEQDGESAERRTLGPTDLPSISAAISTVLAGPRFRARAQEVSDALAATTTPDQLLSDLRSGPW